MWWKREAPAELIQLRDDVRGIGKLVMAIDARLEEIVELLRGDDEDEED